jgi:hypothetical protein
MDGRNLFDAEQSRLSAVNHVVLGSFLSAFGCDPADFEVEVEDGAQVTRLLGLDDRLIAVRQRSSGIERLYVAASYSVWLAALLSDVQAGCYRRRVVMRRPTTLSAAA